MTKKTQKIIESYKKKLNTQKFLYEKGFCNYSTFLKNITNENKELDNMLASMFHYHLISESDYLETCGLPYKLCAEVRDNLQVFITEVTK